MTRTLMKEKRGCDGGGVSITASEEASNLEVVTCMRTCCWVVYAVCKCTVVKWESLIFSAVLLHVWWVIISNMELYWCDPLCLYRQVISAKMRRALSSAKAEDWHECVPTRRCKFRSGETLRGWWSNANEHALRITVRFQTVWFSGVLCRGGVLYVPDVDSVVN